MTENPYLTRTLILLKPDALERGLAGEILRRFERKGFRIVKAEMRYVSEDLAKKHYAEHQNNSPYYKKMCDAITCGPVIAMILEGSNAVTASRQLIGQSSPHHSHVGTIRGDLATDTAYNLVHGSDCDEAAAKEIKLWFGPEWVNAEMTDEAPAPVKAKPVPKFKAPKKKLTNIDELMPKPTFSELLTDFKVAAGQEVAV